MSSATPAAVPAAVSAALAGISIGLLAAWIDAKLKSRWALWLRCASVV